MRNLLRTCQQKGLIWKAALEPVLREQNNVTGVVNAFQKLRQTPKKPDIIFVFLYSGKEAIYRHVKKYGETQLGVATQCVDWTKATHQRTGGPAYQANIAMKMNAKLGGVHGVIQNGLPIVAERPTMVVGADVHHPGVGNQTAPSISALVGSYNRDATKYYTIVQEQGHRTEWIGAMEPGMKILIEHFQKKNNNTLPQHILVYRDGVGEGGFDEIVSREVHAIKRACESIKAGYAAKVTFILVQKRNHIRLFPEEGKGADRDDRLHAGTVVDQSICSPFDFDFFMCSHPGMKGTSKPTHYHVLWDEMKASGDKIQELTFALAHLYQRCTKSVSVPAPAYYAHLASYRARLYTEDLEDSASETSSVASGEKPAEKLPAVLDSLRPILYYC